MEFTVVAVRFRYYAVNAILFRMLIVETGQMLHQKKQHEAAGDA